jgi:hypothetical protein
MAGSDETTEKGTANEPTEAEGEGSQPETTHFAQEGAVAAQLAADEEEKQIDRPRQGQGASVGQRAGQKASPADDDACDKAEGEKQNIQKLEDGLAGQSQFLQQLGAL